MKIGVMQPYFFPYIGYWQLLKEVDIYVVFDDVNYINRGWINRNRILINGEIKNINLILNKASQNKKINEITIMNNTMDKLFKKIHYAYVKAPFYKQNICIIDKILNNKKDNLSDFLFDSICMLNKALEINTKIVLSSNIAKNNELRGEEKILNICECLKADTYVNAIGGIKLYSAPKFKEHNIELKFLKSIPIKYKQFDDNFQSNLSIIDVLMFNSITNVKEFLKSYDLI